MPGGPARPVQADLAAARLPVVPVLTRLQEESFLAAPGEDTNSSRDDSTDATYRRLECQKGERDSQSQARPPQENVEKARQKGQVYAHPEVWQEGVSLADQRGGKRLETAQQGGEVDPAWTAPHSDAGAEAEPVHEEAREHRGAGVVQGHAIRPGRQTRARVGRKAVRLG